MLYDELDFLVREGHYSFEAAYELPTYLRQYYVMKISDENRKAQAEREKSTQKSRQLSPSQKPVIQKPPTKASYQTKAGRFSS